MKKSLFVSVFLHLSLLLMATASIVAEERQQEVEEFEVELQEQAGSPMQVIELGDETTEAAKPLDNFYWGVGIGSNHYFWDKIPGQNKALPVIEISEVFVGYCAEAAGLQRGDLIYLINDEPIVDGNDIRGEGPGTLKLTFIRNSAKMVITIDRCKVYY
jgi:hypothetical protein